MDRGDPGRLEQFFLMAPDMACVIGEGGRVEDVNPAWEKTLGRSRDALVGQPFVDLVHPDDRPRAASAFAALLAGQRGEIEDIELRVAGEGGPRSFLWRAWGAEGRVFAVLHDLTQTRQMEAQVRAETKFNRTLLDISPTFFVAISGDGKTLMMNTRMREALGLAEEEVLGQDYITLCVPEQDRPSLREVFARLMRERLPTLNENRVRAKDGREILVEWHGQPYYGASGELEFFIGVGVEIGERRRIEEALRRSEQKLSLHMQQTPLGVIEWDIDFRVVDWNPSATRIFGYAREEAMGRRGIELITVERTEEQTQEMWRAFLDAGQAQRLRSRNVNKDRRVISCEWYCTPVADASGQITGAIALVDEVTEQEELEAELRRRDRDQAEMIQRLSTPVIEVWEGVLALPIIGAIDVERAGRMTEALLGAIVRTRAAFTIVDLTGMEGVDAANADHLLKMVRATELLGSRCLVSGIAPGAAQAMVNLGTRLTGIVTFGTLRDALSFALANARA